MRNGNGGRPDVGRMLAEMLGQQQERPKSNEEMRQAAIESFNERLDHALDGACPGNQDPVHAAVEQSMYDLLQKISGGARAILPEPVTNALLRVMAFEAMHHQEGIAEGFKSVINPETQHLMLLAIGAALRVKDLPETSGVKLSTGLYA